MSVLSYSQIYASYFCSILLFFFPGLITYKLFALALALISAVFIFRELIKRKFRIPKQAFFTVVFFFCLIVSYRFITPLRYKSEMSELYHGEFLALAGQTFPYSLTAFFVGANKKTQDQMKKGAFWIALIFTVIALYCTVRPSRLTSGGLVIHVNNLNYQSLSYMASYGAAFAEYSLLVEQDTKKKTISKYIVIFVNLITIFLAGGRGGAVSFTLFLFLTFFFLMIKNKNTMNKTIRNLLIIALLSIGVIISIKIVAKSFYTSNGVQRILGFVHGNSDKHRVSLAKEAYAAFLDRPIFGHGIGSVIYELGFYSHNFILDFMVEMGLGGTLIVLFFLWRVFAYEIKLIKEDFSDLLWLYILFSGLVMLLFSGYYLASVNTWWAAFFIISKARQLTCNKRFR